MFLKGILMKVKIIVLCFALFFGGCIGSGRVNPCDVQLGSNSTVKPVPRPTKQGWMDRHSAINERIKQGNVDLIMLGDSITHGWEGAGKQIWGKYYASRNAVNMGYNGDQTENVLWRLQNGEIDGINPKLAVLMIGTNNTVDPNTSAEQIADGIKAIVCQLRTKLPETKVLILSIFPRGNYAQIRDKTLSCVTTNPDWIKNDKVSKLASKVADNKMIFYLDINKKFLDKDGQLTREIMPDLLHPNEKGYQIWAESMEPTIVQLISEKR